MPIGVYLHKGNKRKGKPKRGWKWTEEQKNNFKSIVKKGSDSHKWKGGRTYDARGYVLIWTEEGYVKEHRLVMEKIIGRKLTPKEQVHHKNFIRDDNRRKNLQLFSDKKSHLSFHRKLKREV